MELLYFVSGMWCATCGRTVANKAARVSGVSRAELNYASKLLLVVLEPGADPEAADELLRRQVDRAGFGIKRQSAGWIQSFRGELERERSRAIPPVLLAVTFFLAMWSSMLAFAGYQGGLEGVEHRQLALWSALFGVPAILLGMVPFARAGLRALVRSRLLTLDLFIAVGAVSAVALSVAGLAAGGAHSYADSGSMVLVVLLAAKLLESGLVGHLSERILYHVDRFEHTVDVLRDGAFRPEDVGRVRRGDTVRYRAGETVSLDGRLTFGATVNAHLLSGEADDLQLEPGATLRSGCIARTELTLTVTEPLGLRMIDRWAESALVASGRPHAFSGLLSFLESRLVAFALLGALAVAAARWSATGAVQPTLEAFFVGVLLFCPCLFASILPLARQMAHLALARVGVGLGRPECLFDLTRVERVLLDKTGTLESVESVFCAFDPARSRPRARALLAHLARVSHHPVLRGLGTLPGEPEEAFEVEEVPGEGVRLRTVVGETLAVGRPRFVFPTLPEPADPSPVVAYNGVFQGRIVTRQTFDEQGLALVTRLLEVLPSGAGIEILSGDPRPGAGERFCRLAPGRVVYRGNLTPEEKAALAGPDALFVGDGLNDTLAMARSGVSCRVGERVRGFAPVDLHLASDNLGALVAVLAYSRRFVTVLGQTALLALTYNLVAWSLAAAGRFGPLGAVAAMVTSLVVLVLSASRLLRCSVFGSSAAACPRVSKSYTIWARSVR